MALLIGLFLRFQQNSFYFVKEKYQVSYLDSTKPTIYLSEIYLNEDQHTKDLFMENGSRSQEILTTLDIWLLYYQHTYNECNFHWDRVRPIEL